MGWKLKRSVEPCGIVKAEFPAPCYDPSGEGKVKMLKEKVPQFR